MLTKDMKTLLYSILWILAGVFLFHCADYLGMSCNLFSWHPSFDWLGMLILIVLVTSEVLILWLVRKTKTIPVAIISLLVCIFLAVFGVEVFVQFQNEAVSQGQGLGILVSRSTLRPAWYRITLPMLYITPLCSWICHMCKHQIKSKKANQRIRFIVRAE